MSPGPEGPDGHVGGGGGQEEEGAKLGRARVAGIIWWPASLPSGESPADGLVLHRDRPCTPLRFLQASVGGAAWGGASARRRFDWAAAGDKLRVEG